MVPARADETFGSGLLVQQDNAAKPCLPHHTWCHAHVGHKDLYAGFVPLMCADEPFYMIVGVAHATASGTD